MMEKSKRLRHLALLLVLAIFALGIVACQDDAAVANDTAVAATVVQEDGVDEAFGDDGDQAEDADEAGDVDTADDEEGALEDEAGDDSDLVEDADEPGDVDTADDEEGSLQDDMDQLNLNMSTIDSDGNGQISQAEVDAFLGQASATVQAQLAKFDSNNDGQIDQNELGTFLQQAGLQGDDNDLTEDQDEPGDADAVDVEGPVEDSLDQLDLNLSTLDSNNDGQVGQAELGAFLSQASVLVQAQLQQFDSNNDGQTDLSELSTFLQQSGLDLSQFDVNNDGQIDLGELSSLLQRSGLQGEGSQGKNSDGLPDYSEYPTVPRTKTDFVDLRESSLIYAPSTQAELFVDCIDNAYYPLIPGTVYHLEEQTDEGLETVTITVTNQITEIMGIQATVIRDVVSLDGNVKENTWDWYAQDDRGNVWYLGENTQELEDGEVVSTAGSWTAGVDGAMAGILMPGRPRPGDIYYQEYYHTDPFDQGAEDMGSIISLSEPVSVTYGSFDNALKTGAYNPIDDELENKWYVPGVGVVKEIVAGGDASAQLVSISHAPEQMNLNSSCGQDGGVAFVGTIPVRAGAQSANLEQMAQISAQEATTAAQTMADASSGNGQLRVIQGFLVYTVPLRGGGLALVDAGDGAVLATTAGGNQ